ncbi:MAG: hypothetical protein M0Z59_00045 [Nitrospiraceae bacterium]|nr:hypothetical protein [Nitrospiraceae bacterium]
MKKRFILYAVLALALPLFMAYGTAQAQDKAAAQQSVQSGGDNDDMAFDSMQDGMVGTNMPEEGMGTDMAEDMDPTMSNMGPGMGGGMGQPMMGGGKCGCGMCGMMGKGMGMMGGMGMHGMGMGQGMMMGRGGMPGWGMKALIMRYVLKQHLESPEVKSFLDATKDMRKELLLKKFDYFEAWRNPATKPEDLMKMREDIWKLKSEIRKKAPCGPYCQ